MAGVGRAGVDVGASAGQCWVWMEMLMQLWRLGFGLVEWVRAVGASAYQ